MKKTLVLLASAFCSMLFSQTKPTALQDWKAIVGTQTFFYKNVTQTDASGFIYVAGATLNINGKEDILVAKYNADGQQLWIKVFNGNGNDVDIATAMFISGGYVYITGTSVTSTVTPLTSDRIVIKYDAATGAQQWVNLYDGPLHGNDIGGDIGVNSSSEIFVTGSTATTSGVMDYLTQKISSTGTTQWTAINDYNGLMDVGMKIKLNTASVDIGGVVQVNTGQYLWKIYTYDTSSGALLATSSGSGSATAANDLTDMVKDAAGNMYLCGSITQGAQGLNYYVVKLNSTAVIQWTRYYNGSNLDDAAKGIKVDAAGNVYVTGYSTTTLGKDFATIKYNSAGTQQWVKIYNNTNNNGNDEANDLVLDASNNIYVTGYTSTTPGNADYFTIKYDNAGNVLWSVATDGTGFKDKATNIALDVNNNVIVTGQSGNASGGFNYLTVKYDQYDVVPFTDVNNEPVNKQFIFLPNNGQLFNTSLNNQTDILFYNVSNTPQAYVAKNRISLVQSKRDTILSTPDSLERIDMVFNGISQAAKVYLNDKGTDERYNFFKGSVKAVGLQGYNRIISPNIYPGIDMHYCSNDQGLKVYFVVKPNADPQLIKIILQGQQAANIVSNNLVIKGRLGNITLRAPNVYNINGTVNVPVSGAGWALTGANASFVTGTYNVSQPLVIEFSNINPNYVTSVTSGPVDNLYWCTYIGNSEAENITKMATDKYNNKYITGSSTGNNYPTTFATAFQGNNTASLAVIISKFNNLDKLLHSTFYSGSISNSTVEGASSEGWGIAIDSLQNVFFGGTTNTSNFPFPGSQPVGSYAYITNPSTAAGQFYSGFIIKMDSAMQNNLWGSYIGDSKAARVYDLAIDKNQNVLSAGFSLSGTGSLNFPTPTSLAYYSTVGNGFVFRFSNNGIAQYGTRLAETMKKVACNKTTGDYFIGGNVSNTSTSPKFKNPGGGAYYDGIANSLDYYLARFNAQDSITWATAIGGSLIDSFTDMDLRDSTLILTGSSSTTGFPIKYQPGQYVDSTHSASTSQDDIAFIRFNSYTGKHIYSSYYGSDTKNERANCVAIDALGNYYIGGYTDANSTQLPTQSLFGFYNSASRTPSDGIILSYKKNNDKRLLTFFGGDTNLNPTGLVGNYDEIRDFGLSSIGDLYMTGNTASNQSFPLYDGSAGVAYYDNFQNGFISSSCCGPADGFVAAFIHLDAVSVNELDKNGTYGSIIVYPNPSNGVYNLVIEGLMSNKNITFNVYNALGQTVYTEESKSQDTYLSKELNLSSLSQGIYFINILQGEKNVTVKVIKQ